MTNPPTEQNEDECSGRLQMVIDREEIRAVVYRYCRGIDRMQFDLVRSCYHPDATDDHGDFVGGVGDFVDYVTGLLPSFQSTSHFVGNMLIELDWAGNRHQARVETYCVANHRRRAVGDRPANDFVVGLRYVDDFERRDGQWAIRTRVCVTDWCRTDPIPVHGWVRPEHYVQPLRNANDPVFADDLRTVARDSAGPLGTRMSNGASA